MYAQTHGIVHAGMYVPGKAHQAAWQAWFSALSKSYLSRYYASTELGFSTENQAYTAIDLIAAQTCGYPFLTRWEDTHEPVSVALFDVPGCSRVTNQKRGAGQYSSWFITRTDSAANSLEAFRNRRVALNSKDSNSGTNVLRYAISKIAGTDTFFSERIITGSHQQSMYAIADGRADIAAIDVVTYALICEFEPVLCRKLKIIGQSELTTGLPFICAKNLSHNHQDLCTAMNQAVDHMNPKAQKLLHLSGFSPASAKDYVKIKKLEDEAISAGYPELK